MEEIEKLYALERRRLRADIFIIIFIAFLVGCMIYMAFKVKTEGAACIKNPSLYFTQQLQKAGYDFPPGYWRLTPEGIKPVFPDQTPSQQTNFTGYEGWFR